MSKSESHLSFRLDLVVGSHPLKQEKEASFNCLDANGYDKAACQQFFDAYNECRKRWQAAKAKLRQKERERFVKERGSIFDFFTSEPKPSSSDAERGSKPAS
jgi:hypothetical protein